MPDETTSQQTDRPDVIARPPLIYAGFLLAGATLERLWPTAWPSTAIQLPAGALLIAAGIALMTWAARQFRAAGTNIPTPLPATTLVTSGPYGLTRNPMYVAFNLIYLGVAAAVDSLWLLYLWLPLMAVMQLGVVWGEERYMARKFGAAYDDYRVRVRRWL